MMRRTILHTSVAMRHPWPEDCFVQGGKSGVVFQRAGGSYRTAFVEAFPFGTFLRGEGETVEAAEDACWAQCERLMACPAHPDHGPFERRQYRNGSGFCTQCGGWFARVLPPLPDDKDEEASLLGRALTGDHVAGAEVIRIYVEAEG